MPSTLGDRCLAAMSQHVIVIRSTYLSRRTTDYVIYDPPMNPHDEQRFGRVTLVGLIIAIFGVAFMFGGIPLFRRCFCFWHGCWWCWTKT